MAILPPHSITHVVENSAEIDYSELAALFSPKIQAVQPTTLWRQPLLFHS